MFFALQGKPCFTSSQSLKYIHVCDSLSENYNTFLTDECSQRTRSLGKEEGENNEATTTFVTQLQRHKCPIPRIRCKPLPAVEVLSGSDNFRDKTVNNLSDQATRTSLEAPFGDVFVNDLKTTGKKHSGLTTMTFPTSEDVQCRKLLSPPPYFPLRKSNSLNSLKSLEVLPPVFQDSPTTNPNIEAKQTEGMSVTSELFGSGRETNMPQQGTVCHSGPFCLLKRRRPPPIKQERVLEDGSNNNVACVHSESPWDDDNSTGATGKVSGKFKASLAINGTEQGQGTKTSKNAQRRRKKLTVKPRTLSRSQLAQCPEEDVFRVETTRRKESLRRKEIQRSLEANKEKELSEDMKAKWMKAMRKVFNVNKFLNGKASLQKQRELDKLALEQKQAALAKVYEELKHCRYLRLPSNEDDSQQHDFVTWVFDKK